MNIPLAFGYYKGRSGAANATEASNMMIEIDEQGGAATYTALGTAGCLSFCDTGKIAEGRGGYSFPGSCLSVIGSTLFKINTTTAVSTKIGTLLTSTGPVQFAEGVGEILITDGTYGYVYEISTSLLDKITDADFPTPKACTWKDGFGVVVEDGTGKLFVSAVNDLTSWDALDFTTAEFEPDNLVGCLACGDSLYAFGEKTVQLYYNSGDAVYPFDVRSGSTLQIGCGSTNCPATGDNVILWMDNVGIVRMIAGESQKRISTPQIEYLIAKATDSTEARGFFYSQEGHSFYVLSFPTDELTLVYDLVTGQWHSRTSYVKDGRWRPAWTAQDGFLVLAGDYENGIIYKLDPGTYQDNIKPSRWFITTQNVNSERNIIVHDMLEVHLASGVGLSTGADPQMWLQYSDDEGHTWSRERWRSMGKIGEYNKRVRWYSLGRSRSRIYRFGGSDPVKRHVISATLEGRILGD